MQAKGTLALTSDSMRVTCQATALDVAATLFTQPPDYHAMKSITTQVPSGKNPWYSPAITEGSRSRIPDMRPPSSQIGKACAIG